MAEIDEKEAAKWEDHPAFAQKQLTLGEKAADTVRNGMGSWPFVFSFLGMMACWAIFNTFVFGNHGFDPYPYILLNLFLSMIAGLQGAILLIAAKRADAISAELAMHTFDNTEVERQLLHENTELTKQIQEHTAALEEIHRHVAALTSKLLPELEET